MMSGLSKNESSQAMQNLFSAYGDDDLDADESMQMDMVISDDDDEASNRSSTPSRSKLAKEHSQNVTPEETDHSKSSEQRPEEPELKKAKLERIVTATRLVSYGPDDQDAEGEEENEEGQHDAETNIFSRFKSSPDVTEHDSIPASTEDQHGQSSNSLQLSFTEDDVQIPPEPTGNCSLRLQTKIEKLYQQYLHSGRDMNAAIQERKIFRNPSIYDKLLEFCSIDEKGTNYPPELFNPTIWGEDSTYEVLAQIQHAEMEKRTKKDKATVERVQGTKKQPTNVPSPSADHKHKTKWDSVSANSHSAVKIK